MDDKTSYHVHPSGGLLSSQFIDRLRQEYCKEEYVDPKTFSLDGAPLTQKELDDRITKAWKALLERWDDVSLGLASYEVSEARGRWIMPLLRSLGYEPVYLKKDTAVPDDDLKLALSHRGGIWKGAPITHTVVPKQKYLDEKIEKGRGTKSPHDSLQIFLNSSSEDLWGIVTNGIVLRILRKYYHTYTKGYIEFDLEGIFEERSYSDFLALYKLAHASRFMPVEDGVCVLEHFYKKSLAAGEKIGDDLRENVKAAIEVLANGFITPEMAEKYIVDQDACKEFYREILHVVYRVMFLMFAEQRGMLPSRDSLYADSYSVTRLRERAEKTHRTDKHSDAWKGLLVTFEILGKGVDDMTVFGYNGGLFDLMAIRMLNGLDCENTHLLRAVEYLTFFESEGVRQRISYVDLGVEEIGSIYESLLDYVPRVLAEDVVIDEKLYPARRFFLDPRGAQRKSTGSYYTNPKLVNELIRSALQPVVEDRLSRSGLSVEEKEKALLSIKVCDPAIGSGAFQIAANNYLGRELAKIRTGTDYPPEPEERRARRDVLQHCIYGVDVNPMAVELAKVSLWINACVNDMPLNFLDHHIKCGNSLICVTPDLLEKGIPNDAFAPVEGDDKDVAKEIIKRNKHQKEAAILDGWMPEEVMPHIHVEEFSALSDEPETDPEGVKEKKRRYESLLASSDYANEKFVADLWTSAFFWPLVNKKDDAPTHGIFKLAAEKGPSAVGDELRKKIEELADEYRFFHWHLEFPEVYAGHDPGFDCVLGNPPWEKVRLEEEEFFKSRDEAIAGAPNAATRKKLINDLPKLNPSLANAYRKAKYQSDLNGKFFRNSNAFPLTGRGDVNTYSVFLERSRQLIHPEGRIGMIVLSGIATDSTTKDFFADLMDNNALVSLYDFENRERLFPIDSRIKFSLVTLASGKAGQTDFVFYLTNVDQIREEERHFTLSRDDLKTLSPNTGTCLIFRSKWDAELNKKIYRKFSVLLNENVEVAEAGNPWNIKFVRPFDAANDSILFRNKEQLESEGWQLREDGYFWKDSRRFAPIYEARMIWQYDHRFGTFEGFPLEARFGKNAPAKEVFLDQKRNTEYVPVTRYWIPEEKVRFVVGLEKTEYWNIVYRFTTSPTNERTMVSTILPAFATLHITPLVVINDNNPVKKLLLLSVFNSFVFDYLIRNRMGRQGLDFFFLKQVPVVPPQAFEFLVKSESRSVLLSDLVTKRVLELVYTSINLKQVARDLTYEETPFVWDDERRAQIRSELDAIVAHLYGVTRDELDYILETFPIVKRKDEAKYGEYRTKRLILEYYDKYEGKIAADATEELEVKS